MCSHFAKETKETQDCLIINQDARGSMEYQKRSGIEDMILCVRVYIYILFVCRFTMHAHFDVSDLLTSTSWESFLDGTPSTHVNSRCFCIELLQTLPLASTQLNDHSRSGSWFHGCSRALQPGGTLAKRSWHDHLQIRGARWTRVGIQVQPGWLEGTSRMMVEATSRN